MNETPDNPFALPRGNPRERVNPLFKKKLLDIKERNELPASFSKLTEAIIPYIDERKIVEHLQPHKRRYQFWKDNYGAIMESIYILLVIFGFILASLIALTIGHGYFTNANVVDISHQSDVGNATLNNWNRIETGGTMDSMIVGFYFGSHILMIVLSSLIPLNVVFFVFNLLFMIVGVVIASAFQSFIIPMLQSFGTTNIPMTYWLGRHIIVLYVAFIAVMIVVMIIANRGKS